ncbi:hypothetical protein ARMSODRAFT_808189 [Armillaria solidipes]|uniref:Secreted protein n=1 Tax=Armillaria solidipes TaxID=1076256 RepID=A0A2H3AJK5_9AGAR|nr:hypothetical protein ARMSODRAFT_808189 [Armillaria solidipes]
MLLSFTDLACLAGCFREALGVSLWITCRVVSDECVVVLATSGGRDLLEVWPSWLQSTSSLLVKFEYHPRLRRVQYAGPFIAVLHIDGKFLMWLIRPGFTPSAYIVFPYTTMATFNDPITHYEMDVVILMDCELVRDAQRSGS